MQASSTRRYPDASASHHQAMTDLTRARIVLILQYEPSWFAEFMSALGISAWSVLSWFTDDYRIHGWEWLMPGIGILFGPLRAWLLFHLDPAPRVVAAAAGAVWWGWLAYSMWKVWGAVPGESGLGALFVGDMLTLMKFSLAAVLAEREAARDAD